MSEHTEQAALFEWAGWQSKTMPELSLMFAIPNGAHKSPAARIKFKREGLKAGVPDLFLPVPRKGFHGLFIEMKDIKGRPSNEQIEWLSSLTREGYRAVICKGFDAARAEIVEYLG